MSKKASLSKISLLDPPILPSNGTVLLPTIDDSDYSSPKRIPQSKAGNTDSHAANGDRTITNLDILKPSIVKRKGRRRAETSLLVFELVLNSLFA
jgi:hypothetical protein